MRRAKTPPCPETEESKVNIIDQNHDDTITMDSKDNRCTDMLSTATAACPPGLGVLLYHDFLLCIAFKEQQCTYSNNLADCSALLKCSVVKQITIQTAKNWGSPVIRVTF